MIVQQLATDENGPLDLKGSWLMPDPKSVNPATVVLLKECIKVRPLDWFIEGFWVGELHLWL